MIGFCCVLPDEMTLLGDMKRGAATVWALVAHDVNDLRFRLWS